MDLPIRRATSDDLPAIVRLDEVSFAERYEPEDLDLALALIGPDQFLVAIDGAEVVGVTGEYDLTMTLPGGTQQPVPGVTWVSVAPTHRRRGVLRALMERQLGDHAAQGHPAAVLTASESGIYGRFGYGPATQTWRLALDRRRAGLRRPPEGGTVRIATAEEAAAAMPGIHERWRAAVPGAIARSPERWAQHLSDHPSRRDGLSPLYFLLHDDGYVAYRVKQDWNDWDAQHTCVIRQFVAMTLDAEVALWQVLLSLDLFGTIETDQLPVDDPLPWLLTEPRLVRTQSLNDGMWVRPLDVSALLAARRYPLEVDVCLEVRDDLFADGRYRLRGGPDGAECARTERPADLYCDVAALGALYLGGHRLSTLARAGQVEVAEGVDLARLEAALLAERAPLHGTGF